jgi:hypothetical protein
MPPVVVENASGITWGQYYTTVQHVQGAHVYMDTRLFT